MKNYLIKPILTFALFFTPFYLYADCSLSQSLPRIEPRESKVSIEWRVQGACGDKINEFKVYYFKDGNWQGITTVLAGQNQAKYTIDWDITNIPDGNYKVRILQSGDSNSSVTSNNFVVDRTPPIIRDDVWILPSGGEILKGKIIIKWNKESVFDSFKLADSPITLSYTLDGSKYYLITGTGSTENSGTYFWDTSSIDGQDVKLKITAKDAFGNQTFKTIEKFFVVDNTAPSKPSILKVNNSDLDSINYISFTPLVTVGDINSNEKNLKIQVYDKKAQRSYGVVSVSNTEEADVQLEPLKDGSYELVAVAIDEAGNRSEESNVAKFIRDSYPPKAPKIKLAAIVNNNLRVSVEGIDKTDENGELMLMNGDKLMETQSAKNDIFSLIMIPQGVYELSVIHKDSAGNSSDKSNIKKVIYDTQAPQDVSISIPTGVALYEDVNVKVSAIDNVGIEKYRMLIDGKYAGESTSGDFILNTEKLQNGSHKVKIVASDFGGQKGESKDVEIRIFNSLSKSHWANNYIRTLFESGVLSGEANTGIIDPEKNLNRAAALKFIMNTFGINPASSNENSSHFKDVDAYSWYGPYVEGAYSKGLISGIKSKYQVKQVKKANTKDDVLNIQFVLKGLGYNIEATGEFDDATIRAIANYQKVNGLKATGSVGNDTVEYLNTESIVKNRSTIDDNFIYFKPSEPITRVQTLKMILDIAEISLPESGGAWYSKYVNFAKENGVMTGNKNGDMMLEKTVTIGEMAKMVLKVKDLKQ